MSHRLEQIESTLQRAIAQVLQRQIADPRITGMISITKVKVTPDLATAFVHVSVLPESAQTKSMYGLKHATRHIQALVRKLVAIRPVPQLEFRLDESLKKQAEVLGAIEEAMQRTRDRAGDEAADADPTPVPEDRDPA
jgi:ribosome-binding factor A